MTLFLNADIFRLKNRNMDDILGNKTNAKGKLVGRKNDIPNCIILDQVQNNIHNECKYNTFTDSILK